MFKSFTILFDNMNNGKITIELGRRRGHTVFEGVNPNDPIPPHYFLFYEDPRRILYGENFIVAIREVKEHGIKQDCKIKILGIYNNGDFKVKDNILSLKIDSNSVVSSFDSQESIRRVVREEYRTEEKVDFSW
jgi:hypothetical protein